MPRKEPPGYFLQAIAEFKVGEEKRTILFLVDPYEYLHVLASKAYDALNEILPWKQGDPERKLISVSYDYSYMILMRERL